MKDKIIYACKCCMCEEEFYSYKRGDPICSPPCVAKVHRIREALNEFLRLQEEQRKRDTGPDPLAN